MRCEAAVFSKEAVVGIAVGAAAVLIGTSAAAVVYIVKKKKKVKAKSTKMVSNQEGENVIVQMSKVGDPDDQIFQRVK